MKKHLLYFFLLLSLNSTAQNIIDVYFFDDSCSHEMIDPEMLWWNVGILCRNQNFGKLLLQQPKILA